MENNYIITKDQNIINALTTLNKLRNTSMTLFVIDSAKRMVGTLTDGDIRRALINGASLTTPIEQIMFTHFSYIKKNNEVKKLKEFRHKGITLIPRLNELNHIVEIIDLTKNRTSLPIDAVLMAGGKGERLRPLTLDTPKPLLKIGSKAIIDRNIENLIKHGINNISVTVNYLREVIIEHYKKPINGVTIQCVEEEKFLGTIGSIKMIKEFKNDTILVMNSDLLTEIDFEDFFLHFQEHDAMMSAAAIPYTINIPYGIFNIKNREIESVSEKPTYNLYANAGIYLLKKDCLNYIPDDKVFNATDLIDTLSAAGEKVIRYPLTKLWVDIGTPEEFRKAQEIIKHID
ncbi:MAG: NTP transferase domain-containing protein [Bacteroidales bacterium]|nr:NTP transferase domain-containing protein [Bacteroidales bacterium]